MPRIEHVWFDFSDTIASVNRDLHDDIKYSAFAELSGQTDSPALREEYEELYKKHGRSNSEVFAREFGKESAYWPGLIKAKATSGLYELVDPSIPTVLEQLAKYVLVSVFSNVDTEVVMRSMGIDTSLFAHILSAAELSHPKPHTEGYLKLISLSNLAPNRILYVGDIEEKDILPAKSVGLQTGMIWGTSEAADYNFSDFQAILNLIEKEHED